MSKNIVLIGMPGCGKTTIGKILSEKLGFKFIDVDEYIETSSGKSIPELFQEGEGYFRALESDAVIKLSSEKASVISTGGGVVKNSLNMEALKKSGVIIFIDRFIEEIAKDVEVSKRPLLKDGIDKLYELFRERYDLYKGYCDFHIINEGKMEEVAEKIMEVIK